MSCRSEEERVLMLTSRVHDETPDTLQAHDDHLTFRLVSGVIGADGRTGSVQAHDISDEACCIDNT